MFGKKIDKKRIRECFAFENLKPKWNKEKTSWGIHQKTKYNCNKCVNKKHCEKIRKDMLEDLIRNGENKN